MNNTADTQEKIELEVERRLKEKLSEFESKIREEIKKEVLADVYKEEQVQKVKEEPKVEYFVRFELNFRIQHIILLCSTLMLILTGVPLKFPKNGVSQFIIDLLGGPAGARSLHHFFALCLIVVGLYHLVYSFWSKNGRKDFYELLPSLKDFSDLFNQIKYFLGVRKEKVEYGRFSYIEKFDYWAVYWGLIMMAGTGILMWFFQGKFEPAIFGEINIPFGPDIVTNTVHAIAREMHSDEALLATLVILGWHFYNVHLNPHKFPMSNVWLTGKMTKEEMLNEHPLELEEIMKEKNK